MYICDLVKILLISYRIFFNKQINYATHFHFTSIHTMLFLNEFQDYFIQALHVDMDWKPGPVAIFFAWTVFTLYIISLIFTTVYCLMQFQLFRYYHRYRKLDRKSTRLNSSHVSQSRMPSSA